MGARVTAHAWGGLPPRGEKLGAALTINLKLVFTL